MHFLSTTQDKANQNLEPWLTAVLLFLQIPGSLLPRTALRVAFCREKQCEAGLFTTRAKSISFKNGLNKT